MFSSTYRLRIICLCVAAILVASGAAEAGKWNRRNKAGRTTKPKDQTTALYNAAQAQSVAHAAKLRKAEDIIGMEVKNPQGERLGFVKEIVTTQGRNRASYAVLEQSELLGATTKWYAVPWPALWTSPTGTTLMLDVPKSEFQKVSGFNKTQWPDRGSEEWSGRMSRSQFAQYSSQVTGPYEGQAEQFKLRKISELLGLTVKNNQGQKLGEIDSIIFATDRDEGQIVYGIIGHGGVYGIGKKMTAVPWRAIQIRPALDIARLDADRNKLESLPYQHNDMPRLAERQYAQQVHSSFNQTPYWEVFGFVMEPADPFSSWRPGSAYNMGFSPTQMTTVAGTVESIGSFQPEPGAAQGLSLVVKDAAGELRTVHAGPKTFADQLGMGLLRGDSVTVTGARSWVGSQPVIMATEISKYGKTFKFRDASGIPMWNTQQLRQWQFRQ